MSSEQQILEAGIAALESQRALLGDGVVDAALVPMRAKLATLGAAAASTEPLQTLKQVSILFVDVVGSTTLSQRLDPEGISAVMDDALARGTAVVIAHGGKVLQYAGDNILAAFGADEAREDDTERTVRCGLALLELGKTLGAEVLAEHQHAGFDVRVGIHTGDVLLGGGVDADGTIRGIAVNIAARMEQTAPAGALRISHDAYVQVRGLFEVDVQEPLTVKGVDEVVQSYLVICAKPRSFRIGTRGIEGVTTRMIGRDAEFEALQNAFSHLYRDRRLAIVTVVADAGVGKSRLLYEFEAWSEARPESFYIFRGRATPQTQGQPFGLLRDILAWRFQIADDDTVEAARAKMEQGIVPLFEHEDGPDLAEGHAHLLGYLIGIEWKDSRHIKGILDDPRQIRDRALHAAAQLFRRISASDGSPIVLQLEDLHWADGESLDFLNYLVEVDRDVPMLVLAFARPTLLERRPNWRIAQGIHQRIDLAPLDERASRDLASELLKKLPQVPATLRELVAGRAEGNPFYMEELVRVLIDRRAIQVGNTWHIDAERLLVAQVPSTLTGVLQARLDGLPATEKLALQEASVIGPVFWDRALLALDARALDALPGLVRRELVVRSANPGSDELREYAFKHHILHQVTYATILKRTRRELHGKLAHWLADLGGLRGNDFLGAAAEHFEQAGDEQSAVEFHARAAEHAQTRMAHDAVLDHARRALAALEARPEPETRELRWRLLRARVATLATQGERARQWADIEAMETLADALGDDERRAEAALERAKLSTATADWPAAEVAARQAAAWAGKSGNDALRLMAQRLVAIAGVNRGDLAGGQALLQAVLAEAQAMDLYRVEGPCLTALAAIASYRGDDVATLELVQQAMTAYQAAGDRQGEAVARGNLGVGWLNLGGLTEARRELEEGLRLVRVNGDRASEDSLLNNLSVLTLWQGDREHALVLARAALDAAMAVQTRDWIVRALLQLGAAELAMGRYGAAAHAYGQSLERAIEIDHPMQHDASAGLARVALARGDRTAALQAIEPLLALDAEAGIGGSPFDGTDTPRSIELTCYRVLAASAGTHDPRAATWLHRAHEAVQAAAARIGDVRLRQGYLHNVPEHREIAALWAALDGGAR
jgi:class 3 adenylate cyclase/tetratricopeptide (TPR) repeat protein